MTVPDWLEQPCNINFNNLSQTCHNKHGAVWAQLIVDNLWTGLLQLICRLATTCAFLRATSTCPGVLPRAFRSRASCSDYRHTTWYRIFEVKIRFPLSSVSYPDCVIWITLQSTARNPESAQSQISNTCTLAQMQLNLFIQKTVRAFVLPSYSDWRLASIHTAHHFLSF